LHLGEVHQQVLAAVETRCLDELGHRYGLEERKRRWWAEGLAWLESGWFARFLGSLSVGVELVFLLVGEGGSRARGVGPASGVPLTHATSCPVRGFSVRRVPPLFLSPFLFILKSCLLCVVVSAVAVAAVRGQPETALF